MTRSAAQTARSGSVTAASEPHLCPTYVRTEMTEATIARIAITTGCSYEQAAGRLAALTPHGRLVEPDEVAERVLNLVR